VGALVWLCSSDVLLSDSGLYLTLVFLPFTRISAGWRQPEWRFDLLRTNCFIRSGVLQRSALGRLPRNPALAEGLQQAP